MVKFISVVCLSIALSSSAFAVDQAYFQIKDVKISNVTKKYSSYMLPYAEALPLSDCSGIKSTLKQNLLFADPQPNGSILDPLNTIGVVVDQIINIGKKIWTIVEAGKPVVNYKSDTANALPRGIACWTDMGGWTVPHSQVYKVDYTNYLGMNVVSFAYRVTFTAKGNVDGIGQYITNATFMPADISVAWGFTFDAQATIPSVFNQGTKEAPLAGMQMNLNWKVTSPLSHVEQSESFFASGNDTLIKLQ